LHVFGARDDSRTANNETKEGKFGGDGMSNFRKKAPEKECGQGLAPG